MNACMEGKKTVKKVKDNKKLQVMKSERQQRIGLRKITDNKNKSL